MAPCAPLFICTCIMVLFLGHSIGSGARQELASKRGLSLKTSLGRAPLRRLGKEGAVTEPVLARRELAARLGAATGSKAGKVLVYLQDAAVLLKVAARWVKNPDAIDSRKFLATWDAKRPCSQWYGVTCDRATGRVMAIALPQQGGQYPFFELYGPLPAELGSLPELRTLILARQIFDNLNVIPKGWASLKKLAHLDLSGSPFSIPGLGGYTELPRVLYNLTGLTYLNYGLGGLQGSLSALLKELTGLVTLRLPRNSFSGNIPTAVGSLRGLMTLDLSFNDLTGSVPQGLGSLKSLTALDLSSNGLSGTIPEGLASLKRLVYLNLGDNLLTGSIPQGLGAATGLTSLDLESNLLTGTVPGSLLRLIAANIMNSEKANGSFVFLSLVNNYLAGPCYSSSSAPPKCTSTVCDKSILGALSNNCLQGCKDLALGKPPGQNSKATCSKFCGSDNPKGPCDGHGLCIPKGPKKTPTCTCNKGFAAPANKPGTCTPK